MKEVLLDLLIVVGSVGFGGIMAGVHSLLDGTIGKGDLVELICFVPWMASAMFVILSVLIFMVASGRFIYGLFILVF